MPPPAAIAALQRTVGNAAVARLLRTRHESGASELAGTSEPAPVEGQVQERVIQRKPADINMDWTLESDDKGTIKTNPAPRAKIKAALVINAQVRDGWVKPHVELTGGHLFKKEYGGPDDPTNVVPWLETAEQAFTVFEDGYAEELSNEAKKAGTPVTVTVHTEATFVERPELGVSEEQLTNAGWDATCDPVDRLERAKQFADVAKHFAAIPTRVKVEVGTASPRVFEALGTDIAPAYVRNDDALDPDYTPTPFVFLRNDPAPRVWTPVNWSKQNDPVKKRLQHEWHHRADWGIVEANFTPVSNKNPRPTTGSIFEETIRDHVLNPANEQILGVYRGKMKVKHIVTPKGLWACMDEKDQFFAGWQLGPNQYDLLIKKGNVR